MTAGPAVSTLPDRADLSLSGRVLPRVLVVHRNLLVAEVLARRLRVEPDVTSASGSADLQAAVALADGYDLVVLDAGASAVDGSSLLAALLSLPSPPLVLVLGEVDDDPVPWLLGGARGWVPVDIAPERFVEALRVVASGHIWLPGHAYPSAVDRLVRASGVKTKLSGLTIRQLEVLQCLVDGQSTLETARTLNMSHNTVRTHRGRLFGKLAVHGSLDAVALAREAGLTPRRGPS